MTDMIRNRAKAASKLAVGGRLGVDGALVDCKE